MRRRGFGGREAWGTGHRAREWSEQEPGKPGATFYNPPRPPPPCLMAG